MTKRWIWILLLGLGGCTPAPAPRPAQPPPAAPAPAPAPPPAPAPAPTYQLDAEPAIDVGLAWDLDSLTLAPDRRVPIRFTSGEVIADDGAGAAVVVRRASAGFEVLRHKSLAVRTAERRDTLWVGDPLSVEQRIRWNGKSWRGQLKVFVNPRGKLTLAARVPLETYLLGVVPYEIGALGEDVIEAGRAQAIAARSYTLFYRGRRAEEGFDLYGTVEDQVFGPVEGERPIATRCVESTRGRAALSEGFPIRANYGSTCGGITAEVWEGWPVAPLAYLESRADRDGGTDWCASSPHHRWREEWKPSELASNLATYAPTQGVPLPRGGVGEIVDVQVTERSRSGRVWRLSIRTTTGEITVPGYAVRWVLRRAGNPKAILRSNLFKIDVRRDRASGRALAIVASGAGNGHGVGLCQTGALGMARGGRKGEAILEHYYSGASVERLY
jgi:stage II sporulation protein D